MEKWEKLRRSGLNKLQEMFGLNLTRTMFREHRGHKRRLIIDISIRDLLWRALSQKMYSTVKLKKDELQ